MAEVTLDLRGKTKRSAYTELAVHLEQVLDGIHEEIASMATITALVHHGFGHLWTGFYRVVATDLLRVGPYQGTLGCLDIRFGRGVCGTAAAERRTLIVEDVHAFPGHITCDARSRSEIVVPVFGPDGELIAVFDIDSDRPAAFDEEDRAGLEQLLRWFARPRASSLGAMPGYSDRINHALAFAAKHHDQQVRKGTALPYLTHPANVAIILTRYGQDEDTVVAGILHDVIEDCVRDGQSRDSLVDRIGEKFGTEVLEAVLQVTERRIDDDGVELSHEDRKRDYLERLAGAGERARWVCAADKIHNGSTILTDLRRTSFPETVWGRFTAGRKGTIRWYRRVYDRLAEVGFSAPVMEELRSVADALAGYEIDEPRRATILAAAGAPNEAGRAPPPASGARRTPRG